MGFPGDGRCPGAQGPRVPTAHRIIGLVLLVPAVVLVVTQQVIPAAQTVLLSMLSPGLGLDGEFVGLDHYQLLPPEWFSTVVGTFVVGLGVGILGAGVGILLGIQLRRAPVRARRVGLAVLGAALVTYGPGSMLVAVFWISSNDLLVVLRSYAAVLPLLILIGAVSAALTRSAGVLVGIGATTAVAAGAMTLQSELSLYGLDVPGTLIVSTAFGPEAGGVGAAMSVLLGLLLGVLGIGAGILLLALRPRLDLTAAETGTAPMGADGTGPARRPSAGHGPPDGYGAPAGTRPTNTAGGALPVVLSVVVVLVLVVLAFPWLSQVGVGPAALGEGQAAAAAATWRTALIRTLEVTLTVLVTGLAAVGLGYLRPFGEHSRRALIVFTPWFFVGLLPLITAIYAAWSPGASGPPYAGLTPPMLTVPLLYVWTYLADGVRAAHESGRPVRWSPVLGLTALTVGMLVAVRSQQHLWDMLFMFASGNMSAVHLVRDVMAQYFGAIMPLGVLTPPTLLIAGAVAFGAAGALVPGIRVRAAETRNVPPHASNGPAPGELRQ